MEKDDDDDRQLTGAGGDDVSAGTSVGGVGGEVTRNENEDAGLMSVADRAAEIAWGKDVAEGGQQAPATHDGTGQSERPE
jgi:hypothetical protein